MVLALIEQPTRGWGDPLVLPPLVVGVICLALFLLQESRARDPMLPLSLFRRRNFAVGNLATLALYGGLGGATFFLPLFLQQVAGYSPIEAGLSLMPVTIAIFLLSRRFGALADRLGPRLFMSGGPAIAGAGLLLLVQAGRDAPYATTILPRRCCSGSDCRSPSRRSRPRSWRAWTSSTPASRPASTTRSRAWRAAGDRGRGRGGRGAVRIHARRPGARAGLSAPARAALQRARSRPLTVEAGRGLRGAERAAVARATGDASVKAFRAGMAAAAALAILGGIVAAVGIENPRRRVEAAECPGGAMVGASRDLAHVPAHDEGRGGGRGAAGGAERLGRDGHPSR